MYVSHIVSIKDAVCHSFKVSKYYPEGNMLALKLKDLIVGSEDKKTAKSIAMHSYKKKNQQIRGSVCISPITI